MQLISLLLAMRVRFATRHLHFQAAAELEGRAKATYRW